MVKINYLYSGKLERPSIAFYAHHVTDLVLDEKDEIILFHKTFINEGTGYDTSTGIFSAPVGGLYQFLVHLCTARNKNSYIGLVLEDEIIAAVANSDSCNTVGAVVRVRSGERVWVKSRAVSASNYRLYEHKTALNTFSGTLINI